MINDLKNALEYQPTGVYTWPYKIEPGSEDFCNEQAYSNNLNFEVNWHIVPSWNTMKANIINNKPMVFLIMGDFYYPDSTLHNRLHYMTLVGYQVREDPNWTEEQKVLIFHPNGEPGNDLLMIWPPPLTTGRNVWEYTPAGSDNIIPQCSIISPNNGGTFSGIIPIEGNATDISGIWNLEFEYSTNHTNWISIGEVNGYLNEYVIQFNTYNIQYDQSVWVRTRARDNFGNWSNWDECDQPFIINNQNPQPTTIAVSVNLQPNNTTPNSIVNVSGNASYDTGNPVTAATVTISSSEDTLTASTDNNGYYSRNINAPSLSGYIDVTVYDGNITGMNQAYITIQGGGQGNNYTFNYSTMCKDVQEEDPWNPINETHWFRTDDDEVNCWIEMLDVYVSVDIK